MKNNQRFEQSNTIDEFEADSKIIDRLSKYRNIYSDNDKVEELIDTLRPYVNKKNNCKNITFYRILFCVGLEIESVISRYIFITFLITTINILIFNLINIDVAFLIAPTIPIVICMLNIQNRYNKTMAELEMTYIFNYRQIFLARIFISASYIFLTNIIVLIIFLLTSGFSFKGILIASIPMIASSGICLLLSRKFSTYITVILFEVVWVFTLQILHQIQIRLYQLSNLLCFLVFIILVITLLNEIRCFIKNLDKKIISNFLREEQTI